MSTPKALVKIIGEDSCPFYKVDDEFNLSGQSLLSPDGKPACLILIRDITQVLTKYESIKQDSRYVFDCSGCSGLVRLEFKKEPELSKTINEKMKAGSSEVSAIANSLSNFSFFQIFDEKSINDLISVLKLKKVNPDDVIISKGEPGKNLYIIASGRVEVLAGDNVRIAILGKGEVFGEMSLLSGEPVGATIKALTPVTILYLNGQFFKEILYKSPSIQIYITRMLARRIADTNIIRSREFASGITGNLSEIPPSEVFQTLHFNQKTGVLMLQLPEGLAVASFREGKLIRAKYKEKEDQEAFFEILKSKEGRFKFNNNLPPEETRTEEIGNFMKLLIKGARE